MDEVPSGVNGSEQLQKADEAHQSALKNLGEVASGVPQLHFDEGGVLMTPREHQAELVHRQVHGHSSSETATKI